MLMVTLALACSPIRAQHWSDGMQDGADWSASVSAFEATWADSVPEKGKGFKPYLRWLHFAQARFAYAGATNFSPVSVWDATHWERVARLARTSPVVPIWKRAVPEGIPEVGGAGRVNRVVIDPADTSRWIACAPSGGVWLSESSGADWDLMGTQDWAGMGVSDVAFHPDNPYRILAATGDSDFGSAYAVGLMATDDGGQNWETTGLSFALDQGVTCSRVHRKAGAPHHILVATSEGVWLSEDDGASFARTLEGLCSDLIPHPGDSAIWHAALRPGALFRSTDGGRHWDAVSGLPSPFLVSRYTLAVAASSPGRVAAIAAKAGTQGLQGFYLSSDSGATYNATPGLPNLLGWTVDGSDLGGQGFYDLALAIDPTNADHIIAGGVNCWESNDAGTSWSCIGHWFGASEAAPVHADHHAIAFVPQSSAWISAHDGGVARWRNGQFEDLSSGLEVEQVYAMGWSETRGDRLIAGAQDNGVNLLKGAQHAQVRGADGFHCLVDPIEPEHLVAAGYFGTASRSTDGGWSWAPWIGSNGEGVHEQGDWNTPMAYAPSDPDRIFVAKRRVYWTDDFGASWNQTSAIPGAAIEVLALSPSEDSTLAVARGTQAFFSTDLTQWTPVSGLPGLPVLDIAFNGHDADTCWMAFGGYDPANRVWRSVDGGVSWLPFGAGLPALPVNALAHHAASGDLYCGTDAGVYVLPATANTWIPYKAGLPEVLCSDLGIRSVTGELLLATYGRGLWRAPLYSPPSRDAALAAVTIPDGTQCSGDIAISAVLRNAGLDTLVSATVVWGETDTVTVGFVLPPNRELLLDGGLRPRNFVESGSHLTVRIIDVVGLSGGLQSGTMTGGPDAVAENDVLGVVWPFKGGTGRVIMETTGDCAPYESAWAVLDSTGETRGAEQHFPIETTRRDTLCLSHGCHTVLLHDEGNNGFAGIGCGQLGALALLSMQGDTVWDVQQEGSAGTGFSSGPGGAFCLPVPQWVGCTDFTACNFDPTASIDDGSCAVQCATASCPGDLDGDGFHGATDILAVLSEFGCTGNCTFDITGDGSVSANDILALLALYGDSCME